MKCKTCGREVADWWFGECANCVGQRHDALCAEVELLKGEVEQLNAENETLRDKEVKPAGCRNEALDEAELEEGGKLVRKVWIEWAKEQPNPKPSWLVEWEGLAEPDKEVDRRIYAAIRALKTSPPAGEYKEVTE